MAINLEFINRANFGSRIGSQRGKGRDDYLAMYSSWLRGFVTDPDLMLLPIDDHLVHRGDGVFDVIRCVKGRIYQLEAHLKRLERSASAISIDLPREYGEVREIIKFLVLKGGEKDCVIRIILSRGPGGFSTDPSECLASQMYITVVRYHKLPEKDYMEGVSVITSRIPVKRSFFATVKSCNYLPNVLMKMEAVKKGIKYAVNLDDDGYLGEGPTENIGVVTLDGFFKIPGFENTLAGTTANRAVDLADRLRREKVIKGAGLDRISLEDVYSSSEVMLMGTSINLLPVVNFDGRIIGSGHPGPVWSRLSHLLWRDMTENGDLLTDIEWEK